MFESQDNDDKLKLHHSAAEGNRQACKEQIANGENVNAVDDLGWTPLMHAVLNGHCDLARDLLQVADACIISNHGVTAFTLAALHDDEELLATLYKILPLELQQLESNNALQVACVRGVFTAAKWLLCNTVTQINHVSQITGVTPLMLAIIGSHYRLSELLLKFGADLTIVSNLGQDVFELSAMSDDKKLFDLLQHYSSPTELTCFDFKKGIKPATDSIDPQYTSNNIYLDIQEDIVLKNSPRRPVFKTCDSDIEIDSGNEMRSMLSPSLRSVFLPSPQQCRNPCSRSWDSTLHCEYNLAGLISPRFEPLVSTSKSPNKGKKRKNLDKSGCSSWLKRFTKRRTRSLEDSGGIFDIDTLKQNGVDFTQVLYGLGLEEFFPVFKEQELDIWTFLTLTIEDLDAMGIHNQASQMRILRSVQMLRKTQL